MKQLSNALPMLLAAGALIAATVQAADTPAASPAPAPEKPAVRATDLFGDKVVAKGKGVEVKRSQVDEELDNLKASAAARNQAIAPEYAQQFAADILGRLVSYQLLQAKITDADRDVAKELLAKQTEVLKTNVQVRENLTRQLKLTGKTEEAFMKEEGLQVAAQAALEREMNITVSPDEIKKFYEDNPSKFEKPEMVRASHILLATSENGKELSAEEKTKKRKLADDLLKRARAGEDFAKLAEKYSEDPGSKEKGGEYVFPRGQMVPEFESAAFNLKPNEVSDIVTTQFGYHIIKLSEKLPAEKMSLAKVEPELKSYLKQQQMQKRQSDIQSYLAKLKKDAGVEILDDTLKPKEEAATAPLPTQPATEPAKKAGKS